MHLNAGRLGGLLYRSWLSFVFALAAAASGQVKDSSTALVADKAAGVPVSPSGTPMEPRSASAPAPSSLPRLPDGKVTLMGGTILRVDHVLDRLTLEVFGGRASTVLFDERTRVFRDGSPASTSDLRTGVRASVDTMLDGTSLFARNIRLMSAPPAGQSSGQIVSFDADTGEIAIRDTLSPAASDLKITGNTRIFSGGQPAATNALRPGALVTLSFQPVVQGTPVVRSISVVAAPGAQFVFIGRVQYLDLHRGLMVVVDPRDNRSYDVTLDPSSAGSIRDLKEGVNVTVTAAFDGSRYRAQSVRLEPAASH